MSKAATIVGHFSSAVTAGVVVASIYYAWEVLFGYRGRYVSLGQGLLQVYSLYVLAITVGMAAAGLIIGTASAMGGRLTRRSGQLGFYYGVGAFLLALLWYVRTESVQQFGQTLLSGEIVIVLLIGVAALLLGLSVRGLSRRMDGRRPTLVLPVALLVAVGAIMVFAARQSRSLPGARDGADSGPNVVMIVLDALRVDHLSAYGYERETSPEIDRLAQEGVLFENAYSHGNRTILAMPALFTSLYPSVNGAISVGALMRPLAEDKTTIAEMLRDRGYTTVALMTNVHLKSAFGMTQGFDRVEEFNAACYRLSVYRVLRVMGLIERPDLAVEGRPRATEITDHALGWLGKLESRPFFLYVHYMDTHHPYRPPEEFADMFGGISRNPRELFMETTRFLDPDTTVTIDEQELSRLRDYYDACIRYNDYEIGRILDRIREISNDRETVVVITADHGDEFMEHGTLYHNNLLIQELIHIPLIVWAPGQVPGGQRISPLVRHIDVMPTIAQMTDAVLPDEAMGESLLPLMTGAEMDRNVSSFAEGNYCTSLIYDGWKAVYVDSTNRTHLYNLVEDPGATRDLAALEPERLQSMQEQLFEYRDRAATLRKEMEAASDEEVVDQLRKLGYIN